MTNDEIKLQDKAQKTKDILFETMLEIITKLATNKIFRQQAVYGEYLSCYKSYMNAKEECETLLQDKL